MKHNYKFIILLVISFEYILEHQKYYPSFVSDNFFWNKRIFEIVIELDLFSFALKNNIQDPDTKLLQGLTRECLRIMSSQEFKENIEKDRY